MVLKKYVEKLKILKNTEQYFPGIKKNKTSVKRMQAVYHKITQ